MNLLSASPFLICITLLGAILILREWQNHRLVKELLSKVLISRGSDALPEESHPLIDAIKEMSHSDHEEELAKVPKMGRGAPVRFNIPGMDVANAMLNRKK